MTGKESKKMKLMTKNTLETLQKEMQQRAKSLEKLAAIDRDAKRAAWKAQDWQMFRYYEVKERANREAAGAYSRRAEDCAWYLHIIKWTEAKKNEE